MGLWDWVKIWISGNPKVEQPAPPPVKPDPPKEPILFTSKTKQSSLVSEAEKWLSVREKGSPNHGPDVEMFQKEVDGKAQGEPWCMAFAQFCIAQVDRALGPKAAFYRKSWIYRTEHCLTCWDRSPSGARAMLHEIEPGMLVIWQFYKDGKATTNGHVGIVHSIVSKGEIMTIEGNTQDRSHVVREGDGVYLMRRKIQYDGSFRLKGILRPWDTMSDNIV